MIPEHTVYTDRCNHGSNCCPRDGKPPLTSSGTKKNTTANKSCRSKYFYQKHSLQHIELDRNRLRTHNFPYEEINLLLGSQHRSQNREMKWGKPVAAEVVLGKWNRVLFSLARTLCYLLSRSKPQCTKWIQVLELIVFWSDKWKEDFKKWQPHPAFI